jgi:hypothetical protein
MRPASRSPTPADPRGTRGESKATRRVAEGLRSNAARNTGGSLGVSLIAQLLSHRQQFDQSLRVDLSGLPRGGGMTAAFSVDAATGAVIVASDHRLM